MYLLSLFVLFLRVHQNKCCFLKRYRNVSRNLISRENAVHVMYIIFHEKGGTEYILTGYVTSGNLLATVKNTDYK